MVDYLKSDKKTSESWFLDDVIVDKIDDNYRINCHKGNCHVYYVNDKFVYHYGDINELFVINFLEDEARNALNHAKTTKPDKTIYQIINGGSYAITEGKVTLICRCDKFGKDRYIYYKNLGYEINN